MLSKLGLLFRVWSFKEGRGEKKREEERRGKERREEESKEYEIVGGRGKWKRREIKNRERVKKKEG